MSDSPCNKHAKTPTFECAGCLVEMYDKQVADMARLTAELAAARLQLSAIRWRKVSEKPSRSVESPKYSELLEVVHYGKLQCRVIGSYCFMDSSWRDQEDQELHHVTHWREIGPPPSDTEPGTP